MLFIVEGIDRTGKTTLCTRRGPSSNYLHFSAPKKHPLDEYIRPLLDYRPWKNRNVWVDRHYLGETIWPEFFNRPTELDEPSLRYIEMFLESRGACPILAMGSEEQLEEASEEEPTAGRVAEVSKRFELAALDSRLYWHPYCYECNDDPHQFDRAAQREEFYAARPFRVTDRWVGAAEPEILLVGEQVGPTTRGWTLPFVPYRGASGHYLLEEIASETKYHSFAMINAFKPEVKEPEDLASFYAETSHRTPPRVVALGNVAAKELKRQGVPHQKVPHPQYWRRFERRQGPGAYRNLIMEAAR